MKIKVSYTIDLNQEERLILGFSLNKALGEPATREEIQEWYAQVGLNEAPALMHDATKAYYSVLAQQYAEKAKGDTTKIETVEETQEHEEAKEEVPFGEAWTRGM